MAWALRRPGISSLVLGARRFDQCETNLGALDATLSEAQRGALDEVSAPRPHVPAENNGTLTRGPQFAGATVDGHPSVGIPTADDVGYPVLSHR